MTIQPTKMNPARAARNGSNAPKSSPGCGECVEASCKGQGSTSNQDPLFFELFFVVFFELFFELFFVVFFFFESVDAEVFLAVFFLAVFFFAA